MTDDPVRQTTTMTVSGLAFWALLVMAAFFLIAGLVLASDVLIPLTLAGLLFVLVTAIIERTSKITIAGHVIPAWMAHVVALLAVLAGLVAAMSVLSNQASEVAAALPKYEERFSGILARIAALLGDKNYQAAQSALNDIKVADFLSGAVSSAGGFLSAFFLVLLYLPFMMAERAPMQKKLKLASPDPEFRNKLARILESMSIGLQRYVSIKTLVSLITGLGSYAVMKPVGLDFAETWAVLAFALNFIPTIGSIIAAALPSLVALVQFDTFTPFLIILCGCGAIQFVVGNILEPSLTGRSLNLSPFMVVLALTFWTAIWGMAGALLSVPITVCLLIVLSHIPATRFLAILMSGDGQLMSNSQQETDVPPGKPLGQIAPETPGETQV